MDYNFEVLGTIKENICRVMVGKEKVIEMLLAALVADGHVLLEDVPGTGKTVMARAMAKSLSMDFSRVQFTPDLLPSDVTGLSFFNQEKNAFTFKKGPVFTNLLLADEINRATPRTQSSLLECMAEHQVTVDGQTRELEAPFFVLATQNPVETLGCYPLPEAQMDRFLMKLSMGKMTAKEERMMMDRFMVDAPLESLESVCSKEDLVALQKACKEIYVHEELRDYMVAIIQETRKSKVGVSPRGTLAFLRAAQGYAMVQNRSYVTPEDIKAVAVPVLAHRLVGEGMDAMEQEQMIRSLLDSVYVPTEDWSKRG